MFLGSVIYCFVGFTGYFYAMDDVCGNILQNFKSTDPMIMSGRVALSFTVFMAFPLLMVPCRQLLVRTVRAIYKTLSQTDKQYARENMRNRGTNANFTYEDDEDNNDEESFQSSAHQ